MLEGVHREGLSVAMYAKGLRKGAKMSKMMILFVFMYSEGRWKALFGGSRRHFGHKMEQVKRENAFGTLKSKIHWDSLKKVDFENFFVCGYV